MNSGLLIGGHVIPVPGLTIHNPTDTPWCRLDGRDYRIRRTPWVRQVIVHTTKGHWPQHTIEGSGKPGAEMLVAEFWRDDPNHSAAHLVVGRAGEVACLADLATICAYHATTSNDWSVGIEMYQESGGGVYNATLQATVMLVKAICSALQIPFQVAVRKYDNRPIGRMINGGPDCIGVFGHRDNAWDPMRMTSTRGRGDPGDEIYERLGDAGAEEFDYDQKEDLKVWAQRQQKLNRMGERLKVDGQPGPATMGAMLRHGCTSGRALDGV